MARQLTVLATISLSIGQIAAPSRKNFRFQQPSVGRAFNERLSQVRDVTFKVLPVTAFVAVTSLPAYAAGECAHMAQMDKMIATRKTEAAKKEATMHLDMSKAE